jgi:ATP-dependent RNA helicase CshB
MHFSSYNLKSNLVIALKELGYVKATPIQDAVIPKAIKNKSLICKAETGSGKTHAFLIPLFNNIDENLDKIQAVIFAPTIELATQTYNFARKIGEKLNIGVQLVSSSVENQENNAKLSYSSLNPKIIIGTPGRLYSILCYKNVDTTGIKTFVLDECDMLLDELYIIQIDELLRDLHPAQRLVFTATMKEHLITDTYKYLQADEIIDVNKNHKVNHNVSHHLVNLKHGDKNEQLVNFLNITNPYFTIVFASNKKDVEKTYRYLSEQGIKCALLNGDLETRERKITMKRIHNGEFNLIIASDIASRGIDIENITCVISLDLPSDLDYYYHRAGRTGRNNNKGDSYIFYNDDEMNLLNKLIAKSKNINFDYYVLRKDVLKKQASINPKKVQKNEVLEAKIKKEISKVRTNKVKPGYKKKVRDAIKKAKDDHKKEIIKNNIRQKKKENASKGGYGSN